MIMNWCKKLKKLLLISHLQLMWTSELTYNNWLYKCSCVLHFRMPQHLLWLIKLYLWILAYRCILVYVMFMRNDNKLVQCPCCRLNLVDQTHGLHRSIRNCAFLSSVSVCHVFYICCFRIVLLIRKTICREYMWIANELSTVHI